MCKGTSAACPPNGLFRYSDPETVAMRLSKGGFIMDVGTDPSRSIAARLHLSRRSLQVALGVIWIFDGLLKFQPAIFKPAFVDDVIRSMAVGQPTVVASTINHMANFLSHEATMWVAVFGLIEIAIGAGMLFRRTVKPALVASFIWGGGIYLFGEGFGMVLTGHTSPLAGAPGAVCFYVLLGVMVWPREERDPNRARFGADSSVAGRGLLGGTGALLVWAAIWIFEAIIWVFPANRTGNAVTNQMSATADGEPGWYAHLLNSFGHAFTGAGVWVAVLLAATSIVIALGPLVSNRSEVFIFLGIALALGYWVTGQGLGELLTFGGTDPNNGPIVALIGLSLLPLVPAQASEPTLAARLMTQYPVGAVLGVLVLALVPLAVAVTPAGTEVVASGLGLLALDSGIGQCRQEHLGIRKLHVRHVDVGLDGLACRAGRWGGRETLHEHVGHGRTERHRLQLEVHRAAIAGGRSERAHDIE